MTSFSKFFMVMVCSSFLMACPAEEPPERDGHQHQSTGHQDGSTENRWQITHNKGFKVTYIPEPDPVPFNQHFGLQVVVTTPDGKALNDVEMEIEADMPEHKHGMNVKPVITSLGAGHFAIKGMLFHMPGHWHMSVLVRQKEQPARERAIFSVSPRTD